MNTLLCRRQTRLVLEMNTLVLETNMLKMSVRTSATPKQLATGNFETDLGSRYLLLTSTHLRKWAVSRLRTHLWGYATSTSCIYAIAFSAGLNGLQVDQVDRENNKRTSTYTQFLANSSLPVTQAFSSLGVVWPYLPRPQLLREKLRSVRRRSRSMLATVSRP